MKTFADDAGVRGGLPGATTSSRTFSGLGLAVLSAVSFGMSGPLAGGLLDTGWSPGAIVLVRMGLAALVVVPFGLRALGGRWELLRRNARLVLTYGLLAVAAAQFCYFSAVSYVPVAPALLIEYTAPAAVVGWLWLRHDQRPGRVTVLGALLAALGLVLVLGVLAGAAVSLPGVGWGLGAMVGAASYFVISADEDNGLPPLVLAAGGLVVGTVALALLALTGLLSMRAATAGTAYADRTVAWWVPLLVLGLVTAALAYTTGIGAGRRLGSRLASFVALLEVLAAVAFAWLLLGQLPRPEQLLGGLLILAGVIAVKLGERAAVRPEPVGS